MPYSELPENVLIASKKQTGLQKDWDCTKINNITLLGQSNFSIVRCMDENMPDMNVIIFIMLLGCIYAIF